ncbi:MAG: hypothetical protein WA908_02320 [Pontixanthobacter sp.]
MSSWAFVAIVAIIIWGLVQMTKARDRSSSRKDLDGDAAGTDPAEAEREIQELRERIRVLERIATDANTTEAREIKAISDEIDRLRDK